MKKTNIFKKAWAWVKSLFITTQWATRQASRSSQPILIDLVNTTDQVYKNIEILGALDNLSKENENWGLPEGVIIRNGLEFKHAPHEGVCDYKKILYYMHELGGQGKWAKLMLLNAFHVGGEEDFKSKQKIARQLDQVLFLNYMHAGTGWQERMTVCKDLYQQQDTIVASHQPYILNKFFKIILPELLPKTNLQIKMYPAATAGLGYFIRPSFFAKLWFKIKSGAAYVKTHNFLFGYEARDIEMEKEFLDFGYKKQYMVTVSNTTDKVIKNVTLFDAVTRSNIQKFPAPAYGNTEGVEIISSIPNTTYPQLLATCILEPFDTGEIIFRDIYARKEGEPADFALLDEQRKQELLDRSSSLRFSVNYHHYNGNAEGMPMIFEKELQYKKDAVEPTIKDVTDFKMVCKRPFPINGDMVLCIDELLPNSALEFRFYPKIKNKKRYYHVPGIFEKISTAWKSFIAEREVKRAVKALRKTSLESFDERDIYHD